METEVTREEGRGAQPGLITQLRPHHVDTVQTNNTPPIWASFGGKRTIKGVSVNYRHNENM